MITTKACAGTAARNIRSFRNVLMLGLLALGGLFASSTAMAQAEPIVVTTESDDGAGSLRQAISDAGNGGEITFASSVHTITLASAITIDKSLTITGNGADVLSIHAPEGDRIFCITGSEVTLQMLALTGGNVSGAGGAIKSSADTLTLDNVLVTGNTASGNGGGVSAKNLTMTNSVVSNNTSTGEEASGGGIYVKCQLSLVNSTVSGNKTTGAYADGGGIAANQACIEHSIISGNSTGSSEGDTVTGGSGGGLSIGTLTLNYSSVTGNSTFGDNAQGGGIYADRATLNGSTVSGNITNGQCAHGGGIAVGNMLTVNTSTVSGNSVQGDTSKGGGIYVSSNCTLRISVSTISGNSATSDGGGIYGGNISIEFSTIAGNSTSGVIEVLAQSKTVTTKADESSTTQKVSGIYASGDLEIESSIIAQDSAGQIACNEEADSKDGGSIVSFPVAGEEDVSNAAGCGTGFLYYEAVTAPEDLQLGALANNGGPTLTHAITADSAAHIVVNETLRTKGVVVINDTDQRGVAIGDPRDIGAYQLLQDSNNRPIIVIPALNNGTLSNFGQAEGLPEGAAGLKTAQGAFTFEINGITPDANGVYKVQATFPIPAGDTSFDTVFKCDASEVCTALPSSGDGSKAVFNGDGTVTVTLFDNDAYDTDGGTVGHISDPIVFATTGSPISVRGGAFGSLTLLGLMGGAFLRRRKSGKLH